MFEAEHGSEASAIFSSSPPGSVQSCCRLTTVTNATHDALLSAPPIGPAHRPRPLAPLTSDRSLKALLVTRRLGTPSQWRQVWWNVQLVSLFTSLEERRSHGNQPDALAMGL